MKYQMSSPSPTSPPYTSAASKPPGALVVDPVLHNIVIMIVHNDTERRRCSQVHCFRIIIITNNVRLFVMKPQRVTDITAQPWTAYPDAYSRLN